MAAVLLLACTLGASGSMWAAPVTLQGGAEPFDPRPLLAARRATWTEDSFSFAVIGECKNECSTGGAEIARYIDRHHPDLAFAVTMGDLLHYKGEDQEWDELAGNLGWFMRRYATFPVMGDQERVGRPISRYYDFYGLSEEKRSDNATWTFGEVVFLMLGYYDPPNLGGANNGRYTTPQATVHDLDADMLTTVEKVLDAAVKKDRRVIAFAHAQYAGGDKYYCCYGGSTRELFEESSLVALFQADNPAFAATQENGIWYIRASGAAKFDPSFFALIEVRPETITIDFPTTKGGSQAPRIQIRR